MDKKSIGFSASRVLGRKMGSIPFSWYQVLIILIFALVGFIEGHDFFMTSSLPVLANGPLHLARTDIQLLLLVPATTTGLSLETAAACKFLFRTSEAKAALGVGTTTLYALINSGRLEARRLGKRTYITAESLEAFVASLAPLVTPTMAKAAHAKWSGQRKPREKPQEDKAGVAE